MPIFQVTPKELKPLSETTFGAEGIMERNDLQRLLREQISVLDERFMVIYEEFGDWLDSSRRIDLLCLDADANLVVVELKRTEDGGHMELQALRYAAMVSAMTFEQLVDTFARYKSKAQPDIEGARTAIMDFLGWDDIYEDQFGQDTRIVLAAADFSKELTTAVMWLIERGIDIRCVRMKPYRMGDGTVLLDVQQLIPLPEATDFQTQIGVKKQAERQNRTVRHDLRLKFWEGLLELAKTKTDIHANRKPTQDGWVSGGIGRSGFSLTYSIRKNDAQVELWISLGSGQTVRNKSAFKGLETQKAAIEADFGAPLDWQELPEGEGCRIRHVLNGGYKSPPDQWPAIHVALADAMVRLDKAMRQRVAGLIL
ncbi:hypothetical protein J2W24_004193 [Variovorax boronicumulans]|uniref:DUF4268 domain-containing protein n=1 Tax=Variovorax boronicumulans TaxID=436515 RepID=UPI0027816E0E|nr:DUF4268 domain-containing protein [Variovorax boronicumulans]MDP9918533.1 hypothetical protein [Variovorax boronicumulans]